MPPTAQPSGQSSSASTSEEWCYLPYTVASGAEQMERDRQLLEQHAVGQCPSFLRFYDWSTPTISLGYHQRRWPEHWNDLTWRGKPVPLVRRPTGGRAVLHQGSLTYAIATSTVGTNRAIAYQTLCQWLINGFGSLGIPLSFGATKIRSGNKNNPNCFGLATGADLCLPDGIKVIGSAQVWRDRTVLQHGSILLNPDPALFETIFNVSLRCSTTTPWQSLVEKNVDDTAALQETLAQAAQNQWSDCQWFRSEVFS
ncbi:MAG: biotin/lipoate A/B protein ligase family protein [Cyanobacteria bacterium P01_D01_bin.73]